MYKRQLISIILISIFSAKLLAVEINPDCGGSSDCELIEEIEPIKNDKCRAEAYAQGYRFVALENQCQNIDDRCFTQLFTMGKLVETTDRCRNVNGECFLRIKEEHPVNVALENCQQK